MDLSVCLSQLNTLIRREARLLLKTGSPSEAVNLINSSFVMNKHDIDTANSYDELTYIYMETANYKKALETFDLYKQTFENSLSRIIKNKHLIVHYANNRVKIFNGIIDENCEQSLMDYLDFLKQSYLPVYPAMNDDKAWMLLRHDAIIYSFNFDRYPDHKPIRVSKKTDFVWKYNQLCREQNDKNATHTSHDYELLVDGKTYSQRDIFKLAIDFWLLSYRPDHEDILDAYDTIIKMYTLLNCDDQVREYQRYHEVAVAEGQTVKNLIQQRRQYLLDTLIMSYID